MIITNEYTREFYEWLHGVIRLLPENITVHQARLFYEKHKEEIMKIQKVNLADKKAAFELLKKLYKDDEEKDGNKEPDSKRGPGAEGVNTVDKLPPNCS